MLIAEHGSECCNYYARLAYSSVIAKTTSSSYFLHIWSKNGNKVVLIPYAGIRVATMGTLWIVFILAARSSVSSSSLNSSKGLKFYIRSNLILNNNLKFKIYGIA